MLENIFCSLIPFLIILGVLVFIHEFGHYWFAKKYDVKIDEFSIGIGPEIYGKTDSKGTRWKISAIPFGGYVMMHGDKNAASAPDEEELKKMDRVELEQTLFGKTPLQRILISAAGPLTNIAYAVVVFLLIYIFCGKPISTNVIERVEPGYPASTIDIRKGDVLLKINDFKVESAKDVLIYMSQNANSQKPINLNISRNGNPPENIQVHLKDKKNIGLVFSTSYRQLSLIAATGSALHDCFLMLFMVLSGFVQIIFGIISISSLGGPISIANMIGKVVANGDFIYVIFFSAVLSLNLAAINFFPLPALDGGNIMFDFLEYLGLKIKTNIREKITGSFFIILMLFMVFTVYNDFMKTTFLQNLIK